MSIDQILLFIENVMVKFNAYAITNPVIAGVISLWSLGVLSYCLRNIPNKIWQIFIKQSTTSLTLFSSSQSYHNFLQWCDKYNYISKLRKLKITSGKWGEDAGFKSIGYGSHYFFIKRKPIKLFMERIENNTNMELDKIEITTFGRSQKFFNKLLTEINKNINNSDSVLIHKYMDSYWDKVINQNKRNMDTVFLDNNIKQNIINHLDHFVSNEKWYIENGISYQTGILLYGISGGGKTSLIKAIASKYNYELYILSVKHLNKIEDAIINLPHNTILLIEDIDANSAIQERSIEGYKKENSTEEKFNITNLSDVLNTLDGIIANHGRILIATTNYMDKLDKALIRPGRFDLIQELGYVTLNVVNQFFNRYYPDYKISVSFKIANNISPAMLQNYILMNLDNPDEVLNKIKR